MSRINLLVAVAVASAAVGCAQCDTCDDFPAPCIGPNCGQNSYTPPGYVAPTMGGGGAPTAGPVQDAAPADPAGPAAPDAPPADAPAPPADAPAPPASGPVSPPTPTDPAARPGN